MAERELQIMSFVRGDYLTGTCTECKTTFMVTLDDDLQSAKDKAQAVFEEHTCGTLDPSAPKRPGKLA